jgi:hypothetical protein
MDALQILHYGQLVHHGEPKGDMRVLAKSAGITDELIELAQQHALIPAFKEKTGLSWGIIRTKRGLPQILTRAEEGAAGQKMYQFIFMPTEALRELAGDFNLLASYLLEPLPVYEMLGDALQPVKLGTITLPSMEKQVESLLDLMTYTKNNTRNIQPLIASVVSGTPLVIKNAATDAKERLGFIIGLLTLLPSSTRFGISFLMHNTPDSQFSAQIMFVDGAVTETDDKTYFDWESGAITGKDVEDEYSKFITSQMRLDPEMVIRETEKLTPTAGWRFGSGDSLAKALDYASRRAKLDTSILNNLPIEAESAAQVLAEDPTLSEDLRLAYARHLMNFSLALDDLTHIDAVTATMHLHQELETEVYQYMVKAQKDGKGALIFETLVRWMDNPFSPQGKQWAKLMAESALAELNDLISNNEMEFLSDYLDDIKKLGAHARPIAPRVIEKSLPYAGNSPEIPTKLLLLAIQHLEEDKLQRLLGSPRFMQPLSRDVKRFFALLTQQDRQAPPKTLALAIASIDEANRDEVLLQFVKMAYQSRRIDLIDEPVLSDLVRVVVAKNIQFDKHLIAGIAQAINGQTVTKLKRPAPRMVLQLLLASEDYAALAHAMVMQSRDVYRAEGQLDYIVSIQETFAETKLSAFDAHGALNTLETQHINEIPLMAAICGALEGTGWDAEMTDFADRVMRDLSESHRNLEVIPPQTVMALLQFQARQPDSHRLRIAARLVGSANAYEQGKVALNAVNRAFKMLDSNERTKPIALEVVRQFVREGEEKPAQHMIKFYSDQLGQETARKLQLSYEFSNMMGRMDWQTYATSLQVTVDLLQRTVDAFHNENKRPNLGHLRLMVEKLRRDTSAGRHQDIHRELRQLAQAIVTLGLRHSRRSSDNDRHIEAVVQGKQNPGSIIDVYRAAGGYLLDNTVHPLRMKEANPDFPLGDATGEDLVTNISIASDLLHEATNALQSSRDMWTYEHIVEEIDSQTKAQFSDTQDDLRQIGRNWQRLADLIAWIYKEGDAKIIEDNNSKGRKLDEHIIAAENPLELFRFVYGHLGK